MYENKVTLDLFKKQKEFSLEYSERLINRIDF